VFLVQLGLAMCCFTYVGQECCAADLRGDSDIRIGYELGWTLSAPKYKVLILDKNIQGLASTPKGAQSKAFVKQLVKLGQDTRMSELSALRAALRMLKEMGAPSGSYMQINAAIESLSLPLDTKATAEVSREQDPEILRLLATLDESDSLLPKHWTRLVIWLKLAHSESSAWGFHLGELSSSLQAASACTPNIAALELVAGLRKHEPSDCPRSVHDALDLIASKMNQSDVNQENEQQAAVAIEQAYPQPYY
jgi:hypothetical protein